MMLRDRFPVADLIAGIDVPTAVVYGTADSLVPAESSRAVAERAAGPVRVIAVDRADHNDPDLVAGPVLVTAAVQLAARAGCPTT